MPITLVHTDNVNETENPAVLELAGVFSLASAVVGGSAYLFASSPFDDGVSTFSIDANGELTNIPGGNVTDGGSLLLDFVAGITTGVVGSTTFLFTTAGGGLTDDGVSVFSVAADGSLTNTDNEPDDGALLLDNAINATTAIVGGTTFLFVAGRDDNGVSVFSVDAGGTLSPTDNVADDANLELSDPQAVATATVGGTTFLYVAGFDDDGISGFSVSAAGTLTPVENITDGAARELDGAIALATAVVGAKTFLFAAGANDNGISVFEVEADGVLTNVFNVTDGGDLELDRVADLITTKIGGTTYLFAAGSFDNGVSVFAVAADGTLINVANQPDNAALNLLFATGLATLEVGGSTFLAVAGQTESGLSIFRVDATGLTINGTAGNDIISAVSSAPGELLPSELDDVINGLGGSDTVFGLAGNDILLGGSGNDVLRGGADNDVLAGGRGRDIMFGDVGRDIFDFNSVMDSVRGGKRDKINHFQRGQDDIDLSTIDAKAGVSGNNKFKFIGTQAFHDAKGELRVKDLGAKVIVQGDVNGDGRADFEIFVNVGALSKGDFLL